MGKLFMLRATPGPAISSDEVSRQGIVGRVSRFLIADSSEVASYSSQPMPRAGDGIGKARSMKALRWLSTLLLITFLGTLPGASFAQVSVGVSITVAPPELPEYEQPLCPAANYIWTPGYWAWGPGGYYWVPGTWVLAPSVGLLWTPGYWGWGDGVYLWHGGYWGPTVGFYGGVNYGFGYGGTGFYGGRWSGRYFSYNTAVVRVNTTIIHNVYVDRTVIVNGGNRVSFNGGRGGLSVRPTPGQLQAERQKRFGAIASQRNQERFARDNKANWASENNGRPRYAALQRPATSARDFNRAIPARDYKPGGNEGRPEAGGRPGAGGRPSETARPGARPGERPGERPAVRPENRPATRPSTTRPATRPESKPAERPAGKPATRPEAKPARPETRPGTGAGGRPEGRPESRPAARPETKPAAKPETKPAARPEARPAARPENRPETRPSPKPAERPAGRPATGPRPETKPAARPESKPAARPESRPAPAARPEAKPAARPAPQERAKPTARPAPQQHSQPKPESHPAPQPKGEGEKHPK